YVNETLVKKMGWTQPLGKHIDNGNFKNRVVGVVRDFHFQSLHTPVEPLYIFFNWFDFEGATPLQRAVAQSYLYIKIADDDVPGTLAFLEDTFTRLDPAHPFEYRFLDDILDRQYAPERRQMQLIGLFAAVCILISCLGLFGLSAFTTAQRTKEIGVRKILGASTSRIILMLFRDVVGLILAGSHRVPGCRGVLSRGRVSHRRPAILPNGQGEPRFGAAIRGIGQGPDESRQSRKPRSPALDFTVAIEQATVVGSGWGEI
ncbi:MAG: hypothetical protein P8Y69_15105, partial [Gammaproteobacteria bacterium]